MGTDNSVGKAWDGVRIEWRWGMGNMCNTVNNKNI